MTVNKLVIFFDIVNNDDMVKGNFKKLNFINVFSNPNFKLKSISLLFSNEISEKLNQYSKKQTSNLIN